MKFTIEYNEILPDGLSSFAGSEGRWLQNLAICLSREHLVEMIVPNARELWYPGVVFKEKASGFSDVHFIAGWSTDFFPTQKARLFVYLTFHKSWEQRPAQKEWLSRDDVIIGYPSSCYSDYYQNTIYSDKSFLIPMPLYFRKDLKRSNRDAPFWAISSVEISSWWTTEEKESFRNALQAVQEVARASGKSFMNFPTSSPYKEVWRALKEISILFPMHQHKSSIEAVISGVVPITIEIDRQKGILSKVTSQSGMYLEYPLKIDDLIQKIERAMNPVIYDQLINKYQDSLADHEMKTASYLIETAIRSY